MFALNSVYSVKKIFLIRRIQRIPDKSLKHELGSI